MNRTNDPFPLPFHAKAFRALLPFFAVLSLLLASAINAASMPDPTEANVPYGGHPRQVLDFWQAESDKPTPLVFVIHGGGWAVGDKAWHDLSVDAPALLDAGISVVSINYRFLDQAPELNPPVKAPLEDAARALQFVRSKASEWNIDKERIAANGSSAGACSSLWLAFHDDMADPHSADPVARESTRLYCVAAVRAQTTLDPKQMVEWTPNSNYGHLAFGKNSFSSFLNDRDEIIDWIEEYSPYHHLSNDDPPVYLIYRDSPAIGQNQDDPTHTSNFGVKLQELCITKRVRCDFDYNVTQEDEPIRATEYLIKRLNTDILILGNDLELTSGDSEPSVTDGTDFDFSGIGSGVDRTFTIKNLGNADLSINGINITGSHADDFSVTTSPAGTVSPGGETTFTVTFTPSAQGLHSATVSISNTDSEQNPFTFAVQGRGPYDPGLNPPRVDQGTSVSVTMSEDGAPTPFALSLSATDFDNDPMSWSLTSGASHGTATASGTGAVPVITYVPESHFNGNDSFTVTVSDDTGLSTTVSIVVTVEAVDDIVVVNAGTDQAIPRNGSRLWTPAEMETVAWFDASDASTITKDGSNRVSQWDDKSGNGRHATQTDVNRQPSYELEDPVVGNQPSIGSDTNSGKVGLVTPSVALKTVYVVASYKDGVDDRFDNNATLLSGPGGWGYPRVQGSASSPNFASSSHFNDAGTYKNGSSSSSFIGILPMPGTILKLKSSALQTGAFGLGFNQDQNDRDWQGAYCEFIFTDGSEDLATEQMIEGYLAHKWGLEASLPADHPYKAVAPSELGDLANLDATVSDLDGDAISTTWTLTSGPDGVTFADPSAVDTRVILMDEGSYTLRLTANDGTTETFDELTITLYDPSTVPDILVTGNSLELTSGDSEPSAEDHTDFGLVDSGTMERTFTIENTGITDLSIDSVTFSGDHAGDFSLSNSPAGTVSAGGATTFTVTFDPSAGGLRSATVSIANNDIDENPFTFAIQGTGPYPPGLNPPRVDQGGSVSVTMSEDGAPTAFAVSLSATDIDGDLLSWSLSSDAAHGTATATGTGAVPVITYAPEADFNGFDSFTVTVSDGTGRSDNVTVEVTVEAVNDAPVVNAGADQTMLWTASPPWTPADMDTVAWFDASDASTITKDGSNRVSQWDDKSGNDRHATQTDVNRQPTYELEDPVVGNQPSIGSDTNSGKVGLLTPSVGVKTVYVVASYKDGVDDRFDNAATLLSGPLDWGVPRVMGNSNSSNFTNSGFNNDGTYKNGSSSSSLSNILPMPGTILKLKASTLQTRVFGLGFNQDLNDRDWQGAYCEWIFTDGSEDLATEQKIEGYLAHKWGLEASLPADHPYKAAAPSQLDNLANLDATVSDLDGDSISTAWTLTSGPDGVTFANPSAVDTTVSFSEIGSYTLRLTANDGTTETFDELTISVYDPASPEPEIAVTGNSLGLTSGDSEPGAADHTDFGSTDVDSGSVERTFTIANSGTADLSISSVDLSGTHAGDFSVTTSPAETVTSGSETTFTVTFDPAAEGLRSATVSIANNDIDENPFTFAIQGTGTTSFVDSDADGIDDNWEELHFPGNLTTVDATSDFDRDGTSDYVEFKAGTDPTDPSSRFTTDIMEMRPQTNEMDISWPAADGRTYRIEKSLDLQNWDTVVESNISPTPPLNTYTINLSTGDTKCFFRVVVED